MYEMSQRHPVWVTENHVNPCNSAVDPNPVTVFYLMFLKAGETQFSIKEEEDYMSQNLLGIMQIILTIIKFI
jgi:hypothetical protein